MVYKKEDNCNKKYLQNLMNTIQDMNFEYLERKGICVNCYAEIILYSIGFVIFEGAPNMEEAKIFINETIQKSLDNYIEDKKRLNKGEK